MLTMNSNTIIVDAVRQEGVKWYFYFTTLDGRQHQTLVRARRFDDAAQIFVDAMKECGERASIHEVFAAYGED